MAVAFDVEGDFAVILDGGEAVTLKRRDSAQTVSIPSAMRIAPRTSEPEPAGGHVAQSDVAWQFPWSDATVKPRLGDAILDAAGGCFTILAIDELAITGRVRCTTRNLQFVYQLNDRVDVQRAVWEDTGGGPEIVDWTTIRSAVPARVQPAEVTIDNTASPATGEAAYRIILGEQLELDADTRLVDPQGNVYQLVEFAQAERIDALPVARVVKVE
jgi:hypothetical protein